MRTLFKVIISLFILLIASAYGVYYWLTIPPTQAENPVITGVHYVGVTVSDMERSTQLYQKVAALKHVHHEIIEDNSIINQLANRTDTIVESQLMKSVNAQLRFMTFQQSSPTAQSSEFVDANGPGIAHICFQVNKNTGTYQKFLHEGASVIGDPEMIQVNPKNPVYYAYVRDQDKTMVEIEHVDVDALNLPKPPENNYRIRHISIATTNMDRSVEFYSTLLETKNPRRAGRLIKLKGEKVDQISGFDNAELEMAWFQVRNLELELIQYHNPAPSELVEPRPIDALGYNMIVFDVVNLAKAREKLITAGGTIVNEPSVFDDGTIMFGRDLDGNLLGFQTLADDSIFSAKNFKNNGI